MFCQQLSLVSPLLEVTSVTKQSTKKREVFLQSYTGVCMLRFQPHIALLKLFLVTETKHGMNLSRVYFNVPIRLSTLNSFAVQIFAVYMWNLYSSMTKGHLGELCLCKLCFSTEIMTPSLIYGHSVQFHVMFVPKQAHHGIKSNYYS